MYRFPHMHAGPLRGQKKMLDPLELSLHGVVSHITPVLGTKLGSCGKTASSLNY